MRQFLVDRSGNTLQPRVTMWSIDDPRVMVKFYKPTEILTPEQSIEYIGQERFDGVRDTWAARCAIWYHEKASATWPRLPDEFMQLLRNHEQDYGLNLNRSIPEISFWSGLKGT